MERSHVTKGNISLLARHPYLRFVNDFVSAMIANNFRSFVTFTSGRLQQREKLPRRQGLSAGIVYTEQRGRIVEL